MNVEIITAAIIDSYQSTLKETGFGFCLSRFDVLDSINQTENLARVFVQLKVCESKTDSAGKIDYLPMASNLETLQ